ncbi:MAG: DUF1549 and DUF1553 domain-containing protein [Gemmataceae bacterium]|nr:DUF1549 and DUF1553 domain-containing protein [Gemmataceae bacterium]
MQRPSSFPRRCLSAVLCALVLAPAGRALAQEPLHERIDRAIASGTPDYDKLAAPLTSDAEFLRRVFLDLNGIIPGSEEARAFLKDTDPDKRAKLIDRLLAGPNYARHMTEVFDALLMDRRADKHVPRAQWQEFLRAAFTANKPYDEMVRAMLAANGSDPKTRSAARFYLDREGEPHLITRDVSRLFLGMNLTCAQCHDHPLVSHYLQDHYYGLFAYLGRSFLFNDRARKTSVFAEKAEGDLSYQSVFDTSLTKKAVARLPGGSPLVEPAFAKGKEYLVPPSKTVAPVPAFSRRARLAEMLTAADHAQFRRTLANRLWAMMLGRGLIEPVEYDHAGNPPSHPELLTTLTGEVGALKFDMKALLRQVAMSRTYQRSSEVPKGAKEAPARAFAVAQLRPLSPEQLAWSIMQATGLIDAERKALGKGATEAALLARLTPNLTAFVKIFGGTPGQPDEGFQATLDQALFVQNGALLRGWLALRPGNLTDRLGRLAGSGAVAEELYLSVLTRPPTDEERLEVGDYLAGRQADRGSALQELAWALLASAEFRFNH